MTVDAEWECYRHWYAIVREVLRIFSVLHPVISICHNAKLVANPLWNVKPVQFRMTDHQQAAIKFLWKHEQQR